MKLRIHFRILPLEKIILNIAFTKIVLSVQVLSMWKQFQVDDLSFME